MKRSALVAVLSLLLFGPALHASVTNPRIHVTTGGSLGFATPLLTEADALPTGDINTSNRFSLESLISTDNASGFFAGLSPQNFGTVIFDITIGRSLNISSTAFGIFNSAMITVINNTPGFLNVLAEGLFTPGTFETGFKGTAPADFRISFTQNPTAVGEISFSGTMSVVPVVPEPSTGLLFMTGVGLVLAGTTLKKLFA